MDYDISTDDVVEQALSESPRFVPPFEFVLDKPDFNCQQLTRLKKNKRIKLLFTHHGVPVYQADRTIFAEHEQEMVYLMKWVERRYECLPRPAVTQIMVWTTAKYADDKVHGFARRIIWEVLFPMHHVIFNDLAQTEQRNRFWARRISEALGNGLSPWSLRMETLRQHSSRPFLQCAIPDLSACLIFQRRICSRNSTLSHRRLSKLRIESSKIRNPSQLR